MKKEREVHIPAALAGDGQVARAWVIAASMPKASRAEVIAACVKFGIDADVAAAQVQRQRYGMKAAIKARTLPKGVKRQIEQAAKSARRHDDARA